MRKSLRPERPPGEFPAGWSAWFASMSARMDAVTGATAEAIIDIFLQREPALPAPAVAELGRWRSFSTLWRQQWQPAGKDERLVRFIALAITLLVHAVLLVLLAWLAYAKFVEQPGESSDVAIRVQFIGEGAIEDEGGGPPSPRPDPVVAPSTAQSPPQPQPQRPELSQVQAPPSSVEPLPQEAPQREQPQLTEETVVPAAEQTLQVTETATVDEARFRLPPPQPRPVTTQVAPSVEVPTLRSEVEAIPLPRAPAPVRPIDRDVAQRQISVPQIAEQPTLIEVPQPLPAVRARELPSQASAAAQVEVPTSSAEPQSLPMPPGATAAAETDSTAATQASGAPTTSPAPASGTQPAAAATGAAVGTQPGSVPTPVKGDDWGDAKRNVAGQSQGGQQPGAKAGLYNADGSLRLPPGTSGEGPTPYGNPPGSEEQHVADLDRAGKWLDRPRLGYEPTRFEKYWVPHETLLQEWVRKGIKKLSIPIPGTSKRIECLVSLLQVGGGCGVTDSEKLFDQPAVARPPPDIPFKRELQEDQGSLQQP
ncbi:hypothetical protein IP90_01720 [Luteimonas cucumeris]|uniref:Transmembrane repetitive protein n=2 Tax=Luteimonas cucumeris TaxID=985012 RepID=A0A562L8A2_9GAMM|nr:hypothetical protein IP90_01720 [Luteimonas cucumeris]